MWFLIALFLALASHFGASHAGGVVRTSANVSHEAHAAVFSHTDSGSGPVGSSAP
jgi:hypothetical protein